MNFITEFDSTTGTIKAFDISFNDEMIFSEFHQNVLIKTIGEYSCQNGKVKKLNLKNTKIEKIAPYAFIRCNFLKKFIYPDSLITIGENAFLECSLTNIKIPKAVRYVNGFAFNSQMITCFEVDELNSYFVSENCFWLNKQKTKLIRAPITLTQYYQIPNFSNLETIGCCALTDVNLQSFKATEKLNELETLSFHALSSIKKVDLSQSNIETIPYNCFWGCHAKEIILPYKIKNINERGFYCAVKIKSIIISSSLQTLGNDVFLDCPNLKSILYFGQNNFSNVKGINLARTPTVYVVPGYQYASFSGINVTRYYPKLSVCTFIKKPQRVSMNILPMIFLCTRV